VLTQAQKYPEAIQLMEKARAAGSLTSEKNYTNLAKLYYLQAQDGTDTKTNAGKAVQVLEDGLSKGIIKPSADNYNLMAGAAYMAEDTAKALDAYRKAIPLSSTGEPALAAGSLLLNEGKYSKAAPLIQQAIDKGVKKKGAAYMSLAEAKRGMKDKAGAIAAMKKAAQDPATASKAKAWLKQAGAK
jgi:tetratricopeptide (TPR) repeat protein